MCQIATPTDLDLYMASVFFKLEIIMCWEGKLGPLCENLTITIVTVHQRKKLGQS